MLTAALAAVGAFVALTASSACWGFWFDEVETPESLIKMYE